MKKTNKIERKLVRSEKKQLKRILKQNRKMIKGSKNDLKDEVINFKGITSALKTNVSNLEEDKDILKDKVTKYESIIKENEASIKAAGVQYNELVESLHIQTLALETAEQELEKVINDSAALKVNHAELLEDYEAKASELERVKAQEEDGRALIHRYKNSTETMLRYATSIGRNAVLLRESAIDPTEDTKGE